MADGNILSDFGINILEEEIDDVIFQTNEFLTDATFTGSQGPFWWILQMCMALAALFAIVMAAGMAYKMMVKHEPLDVLKLFRPLAVSIILCWWYPPADTGMAGSGSSWCFLDFLSYIPNCIGSYTHDLYEAEATQIADKFEEVQQLIHVRDTMYQSLQAQADVAHTGYLRPEPGRSDHGTNRSGRSDEDGERRSRTVVYLTDGRSHRRYRQNHHAYRSDCVSYRMVGNHLLPANPTGHVNNIRTYTMGVLAVAQMGRCMGEVAYKVSDSTFLWCNALLRRLLCATVIRHCTVHTGRKPDGNHSKRTDNGGLLAKQLLLRRLLDGGKYRGTEMPKPRAGLGSMDDT